MTTSWIIYQIMTFLEPIREPRLQGHQVNRISKRDQPFQEGPDHPQREEEVAAYRHERRQIPKAHAGEHVPQPGAQTEQELPPPTQEAGAPRCWDRGGQSPATYPLPLEV